MLDSRYIEQVATLIEIIPLISADKRFAIKGGTAINLFLLNMPRLSVDIDLCYLPITPREQALSEISEFVKELSRKVASIGFKTKEKKTSEGYESTIFVQSRTVEVKIEINLVVRGSVYEPIMMSLMPAAEKMFKRSAEMLCLDVNDLFAGKICASLDRQHPRDFFDLHMFLKEYQYTRKLHETFIVYLLSSKRPISDLISPNFLNITDTYDRQFYGMTTLEIDCQTLEQTRKIIFELTASSFTDQEKEFLLSFKSGEPNWDLFPIKNIQNFPSVKWKLYNIQRMEPKSRLKSLEKLERKLYR